MGKQIVYVTRNVGVSNEVEIWIEKPCYNYQFLIWNFANNPHDYEARNPPMTACAHVFAKLLGWSEEELLEWTAGAYYFELELEINVL
jgi:hypothetical protein